MCDMKALEPIKNYIGKNMSSYRANRKTGLCALVLPSIWFFTGIFLPAVAIDGLRIQDMSPMIVSFLEVICIMSLIP